MKKQIKGKRYNTDTAIRVCDHDSGTLYLKQSGEFFLTHGDKINPLDYGQALTIAEAAGYPSTFKHLADYYSKAKVQINPQITAETAELLKAAASASALGQSHIVELALREFFSEQSRQLAKILLLDNIEITGTNQHSAAPDKEQ